MEVLFNIPSTAHILGGCPMGDNVTEGVNPSFTITAQAEYAMEQIQHKPPENDQ